MTNLWLGETYSQAPSNIALVKYWGKHGIQLPCNPSISLTLKNSQSKTSIRWRARNKDENRLTYFFENKQNEKFTKRIEQYLNLLDSFYPDFKNYYFEIKSENTFPHSCGIASSASFFASLAMGLMKIANPHIDYNWWEQAGEWARLGSGSATRSLRGSYNLWGKIPQIERSNDYFGISLDDHITDKWPKLKDAIVVVSGKEKEVSSAAGHKTMEKHPLASYRYLQAQENCLNVLNAFKAGDFSLLGQIMEKEALTLHALMMTASSPYWLLKGRAWEIMDEVINFRSLGNSIYFTLDAGTNVHLIYPENEEVKIEQWIIRNLSPLAENGKIIFDQQGEGATCVM